MTPEEKTALIAAAHDYVSKRDRHVSGMAMFLQNVLSGHPTESASFGGDTSAAMQTAREELQKIVDAVAQNDHDDLFVACRELFLIEEVPIRGWRDGDAEAMRAARENMDRRNAAWTRVRERTWTALSGGAHGT